MTFVEPNAVLKAFFDDTSAIRAIVDISGTHTPRLRDTYELPVLLFRRTAGQPNDPSCPGIVRPTFQFFAVAETAVEASELNSVLYGTLIDMSATKAGGGLIRWAEESTSDQDLIDPDIDKPMVMSFWQFNIVI